MKLSERIAWNVLLSASIDEENQATSIADDLLEALEKARVSMGTVLASHHPLLKETDDVIARAHKMMEE